MHKICTKYVPFLVPNMYQSGRSDVGEFSFDVISGSIRTNFFSLSTCYDIGGFCLLLFVIILAKSCARSHVSEFSFDVIFGSIKSNLLL